MLEAASLVLDHRGASGCAVTLIWTRMLHAVSEERCAASCDASAIEHERGIGRLHGGRGFAAKTDNVENGVSCGAICGRCTHRLSKPQVGWYFMAADPCVCPIATKHAKITSFPVSSSHSPARSAFCHLQSARLRPLSGEAPQRSQSLRNAGEGCDVWRPG